MTWDVVVQRSYQQLFIMWSVLKAKLHVRKWMRQISGDVIKVVTANEHFPHGDCLMPHWQERPICSLQIYLDHLQGILKVAKASCEKTIDQSSNIIQGWQKGKRTLSCVTGILTRVWRTFLRGYHKHTFKWVHFPRIKKKEHKYNLKHVFTSPKKLGRKWSFIVRRNSGVTCPVLDTGTL